MLILCVQVRKDKTTDSRTFDRRVLEDLDTVSHKGPKSYPEDTQSPHQRVPTERITVSRHDIAKTEEPDKPKYPKDLDIGRIVIEEIPEEKVPKRESPRKEHSKPIAGKTVKSKETTMPRKELIEHETKVHKEYTTGYEERPWERRTVDERVITYTDKLGGMRKVMNLNLFYYLYEIILLSFCKGLQAMITIVNKKLLVMHLL